MSRLDEIKARCDAATPGPWSAADERELWREDDPSIEPSWCVSQMRPGFEATSPTEGYMGDVFTTAGFFESTRSDAEFIAAAREDVPWLIEQVERLERWKAEAAEVMSGLRELGKALGLGLGVQITGPAALAEVARLTAERDSLVAQVARVEALAKAMRRSTCTDDGAEVLDLLRAEGWDLVKREGGESRG